MISLENLTKRYPGQGAAAVEDLSLDIAEGEIVTFVGPSGCGKTTTMKLINRLIEPTSGRIRLEGQDITAMPVHLVRRRIGYAIQQGGLFPHRTVADNIATVPKLLGWDRGRIEERVSTLLRLVGLDPDLYRDRYPKQLSGGQQQRVGVARALGGDPPVMLMDEPFGAVDPLNRESLQNEFLRIQQEVRKTIVFVTHDIDEAIKMGDRIVIFSEGGRILQHDTPERILAAPANSFVADFIGSGASVRHLSLIRFDTVTLPDWPTVSVRDGREQRAAAVAAGGTSRPPLVLDDERRPLGWCVPAERAEGATSHAPDSPGRPGESDGPDSPGRPDGPDGLVPVDTLGPRANLYDALDQLLTTSSPVPFVAVVDGGGRFRGVVGMDAIRELINAGKSDARGSDAPRSDALREG